MYKAVLKLMLGVDAEIAEPQTLNPKPRFA